MLRSDGTRVCLVCIEEDQPMQCPAGHSYEEFGFFVEGYSSIRCRECNRLNQIPQRLRSKYRLTVTRFEEMLQAQDMSCPLCGKAFDLSKHNGVCVDHDHACCKGEKTCGKCIRGILCGDCNKKLHDDVEWHLRAIEYLKRYRLSRDLHANPRPNRPEMYATIIRGSAPESNRHRAVAGCGMAVRNQRVRIGYARRMVRSLAEEPTERGRGRLTLIAHAPT